MKSKTRYYSTLHTDMHGYTSVWYIAVHPHYGMMIREQDCKMFTMAFAEIWYRDGSPVTPREATCNGKYLPAWTQGG